MSSSAEANPFCTKNVPHWLKQTNFAPSFQNRIVSRQVSTRCVADHLCTCRAASRNALPRLHTGDLASSHTHSPRSRALSCGLAQRTAPDPGCMRVPPRSRGLGCVHASACTHQPRTEQLSIRVQATHRPGVVPMPPGLRKVSSSTAKDSNKGSSAGASFRTSAHGDAGMGQGAAAGAAGKQTSRTAARKRIRSVSPSSRSEESHHSDGTPASPTASDGSVEEVPEQCSSRLDWMPFTPPPTAAKRTPQVKTGSQSRRNRAAAAALAHNQLVEGCKTPEEFVGKVVYGAIPGMFRQWVDKSPPHDAPQTVWAELFERGGQ